MAKNLSGTIYPLSALRATVLDVQMLTAPIGQGMALMRDFMAWGKES